MILGAIELYDVAMTLLHDLPEGRRMADFYQLHLHPGDRVVITRLLSRIDVLTMVPTTLFHFHLERRQSVGLTDGIRVVVGATTPIGYAILVAHGVPAQVWKLREHDTMAD